MGKKKVSVEVSEEDAPLRKSDFLPVQQPQKQQDDDDREFIQKLKHKYLNKEQKEEEDISD